MSTEDILKYIEYLAISIDNSLKMYHNTDDFKDFEFIKTEVVYIYNIYKKRLSLATIDEKRIKDFLEKLDSLFDKYLIEEFDYYGNILRARYDNDIHLKRVKNLRKNNRKKREKTYGKK